jgi:hypothetical protein
LDLPLVLVLLGSKVSIGLCGDGRSHTRTTEYTLTSPTQLLLYPEFLAVSFNNKAIMTHSFRVAVAF